MPPRRRKPETVPPPPPGLDALTGIAVPRRRALAAAGLRTLQDLVAFLPRAHLDRSVFTPISALSEGDFTVRARVRTVRVPRFRRRVPFAEAVLDDGTGQVRAVWFGRHDVKTRLAPDVELLISGQVVKDGGARPGLRFRNPDFELLDEEFEGLATGGIVAVYPAVRGAGPMTLRRAIRQALDLGAAKVREHLPAAVLKRHPEWPRGHAAYPAIHRPASASELEAACSRWIYDEFFVYELGMALRRDALRRRSADAAIPVSPDVERRIRARLPFPLTRAQERAFREIRADLASGTPMNRLLQGDVGSGKTAVAFASLLAAVAAGGQGALLAPTETLAEQHFRVLTGWLAGSRTSIVLLTGSVRAAARRETLAALGNGRAHLAVGTHALLEPDVSFRDLRLAVVDEQHRFGVRQRAAIAEKGRATHILVMTATPIPRTLALTAFGDLDVSTLDELPPGRTPVVTRALDATDLSEAWRHVAAQVAEGRQAYVVHPLVDPSDRIAARSAVEMHAHLAGVFPGLRVALLHGRLPAGERAEAMESFRAGRTHILVSTVVIEVGVDVPNATVMLVANAERFGLAQLHQLRGRIGRSAHPSSCWLAVGGEASREALRRLRILEETHDGFRIAEADLALRGPGEFLGTRQSGAPAFHLANLVRDVGALLEARAAAFALVEADPSLSRHARLREVVRSRLGERLGLGSVL